MGFFFAPNGYVECSSDYMNHADQLYGPKINGVFKIRSITAPGPDEAAIAYPIQESTPGPSRPPNPYSAKKNRKPLRQVSSPKGNSKQRTSEEPFIPESKPSWVPLVLTNLQAVCSLYPTQY